MTARDDTMKRILSIRDDQLRFTEHFSWLPRRAHLATGFPATTVSPGEVGAVSDLTGARSRFTAAAFQPSGLEQTQALLAFALRVAPEPASTDTEGNTVGAADYAGVFYRTPVRARIFLTRKTGTEVPIGAPAPILQLGMVQAIHIEGSPIVARDRGATWSNGSLTSVAAGGNSASGPAALDAISSIADFDRTRDLAREARELAELQSRTSLEKARQAYLETITPTTATAPN
jgi:hypothetical protein